MVTGFYAGAEGDVSFGDIFRADFFHDVYLRADAAVLGTRDMPQRYGGGLVYGRSYERNRQYVLGHGAPHAAVLITDSCVIDTCLGQGREAARPGRLLFAPITSPAVDEVRAFGRFLLPAEDQSFEGGVAELQRCFMVDSRDVAAHVNARVARLGAQAAEDLEVRWNAYAARRGPLADARNAEKVAMLLAQTRSDQDLTEAQRRVGLLIARALTASWRVEGYYLESAADAYDREVSGDDECRDLALGLRDAARRALDAAEAISPSEAGGPRQRLRSLREKLLG